MVLSGIPFQNNPCTEGHFSKHRSLNSSLPTTLAKLYQLFFMYFSVRNVKSVPPPTVPLFNPRELHFGREDAPADSLTEQINLPHKGTHTFRRQVYLFCESKSIIKFQEHIINFFEVK